MGSSTKSGLLERLQKGVVIGDGGFLFALEKRGYVKAGPWTPEVCVEQPDAVRQLHREFCRAGADVVQAFSFNALDERLDYRGHTAAELHTGNSVIDAACKIAQDVSNENNALVCGSIAPTIGYANGKLKNDVQAEFLMQINVFLRNKVDFLVAEYFESIEEMVWCIEMCKQTGLPLCACMCIGPEGDPAGPTTGDCAVAMAQAGADAVGVNCRFGLDKSLETMSMMKKALDDVGLKPYLIAQPIVYHTPDAGVRGFIALPEFPFALEPRVATRWEIQKWARSMYDLGVRYIGGCCGFEPYHVRAIAEELSQEHGGLPIGSGKHDQAASGLAMHTHSFVRKRACQSYWMNLMPATGRPYAASMTKSD